jgi:hypothetical protein
MDQKQMSLEGRSADKDERPSLDPGKIKDCPDCGGTGFYYPKGFEGGVAKCRHVRLENREQGSQAVNSKTDAEEQ